MLFNDLHFYFFPNNDVHPARRMRIQKAIDYGATWERAWCDNVTHVIVDKSMTISQLLKYIRVDDLPDRIVIVNEDYPADCIGFRTMLDPALPQFSVQGRTACNPAAKVHECQEQASPKLKTAARAVAQIVTPSQEERVNETFIGPNASPSLNECLPHLTQIADSFVQPDVPSTRELDEALAQAKNLSDLPLEDELDSRPSSKDGAAADPHIEGIKLLPTTKANGKMKTFQDKFQCMQKHTGKDGESPNLATIAILQQMADYYGQTGDEWRVRAYRKAISTLRTHPHKVCTKEEALALPNVGDRLATKIEEIVLTNRLRRLESAQAEPSDELLRKFTGVYGAGHIVASQWVRKGYKSLDELLEKGDLTANQRIGIEHYEDFQQRIPRQEVERHGDVVRKELQKHDPTFEVIIGGSYRRGSKDTGDIDCMITRPGSDLAYIRSVVVEKLVPSLFSKGFLTAELAATSRTEGSKWHGASCLPEVRVWRRIDFLFVPPDELGAALIYFTGNDIFNRSLRLLASKYGMRLNQRGLYKDVMRGEKRMKITDGTLLEGADEKRIFQILNVPWRPPEHRNC